MDTMGSSENGKITFFFQSRNCILYVPTCQSWQKIWIVVKRIPLCRISIFLYAVLETAKHYYSQTISALFSRISTTFVGPSVGRSVNRSIVQSVSNRRDRCHCQISQSRKRRHAKACRRESTSKRYDNVSKDHDIPTFSILLYMHLRRGEEPYGELASLS